MRKRLLLWSTVLVVLASIGFAIIPFASALKPNVVARNNSTDYVTLSPIKAGEVQRVTVRGKTLFILRPSPEQWQSIHQMDGHVWNPELSAWNSQLKAFVYWGTGTRWGRMLFVIPSATEYSSYAANRSSEASPRIPLYPSPNWPGGYWSYDDVSYDYAGRAIKDANYSAEHFVLRVPDLETAHVELLAPEKLAVYFMPYMERSD